MQTYLLAIYVSIEQEEAIKQLFHERCWHFQKTEFSKSAFQHEYKEDFTEEDDDLYSNTEDDTFTHELSRENTIEYFDVNRIEKLNESKKTDNDETRQCLENHNESDKKNESEKVDVADGLNTEKANYKKVLSAYEIHRHLEPSCNQIVNDESLETYSTDGDNKNSFEACMSGSSLAECNKLVSGPESAGNDHIQSNVTRSNNLIENSTVSNKETNNYVKGCKKQRLLHLDPEVGRVSTDIDIDIDKDCAPYTNKNALNIDGENRIEGSSLKEEQSLKINSKTVVPKKRENIKDFTKFRKSRNSVRTKVQRTVDEKEKNVKRTCSVKSKLRNKLNQNGDGKNVKVSSDIKTIGFISHKGKNNNFTASNILRRRNQSSVKSGASARITSKRLLQKLSSRNEKLNKQRLNRSLIREKLKNKNRPLKTEKPLTQAQNIQKKDLKGELKGDVKNNLDSSSLTDRHKLLVKEDGKHYKCSYCNRLFLNKLHYLKHVDQHMKSAFDCPDCGKKFSSIRNLNSHKYNRSKERHFECDVCGVEVNSACALRSHKKENHRTEETYQCHLCAKIVKTKSYLNVHLKYAHKIDEGKYECPFCEHKSKRPKLFAKHVKQHLEEKNEFADRTCLVCGKVCETKSQLNNHKRVHCEKKYLCDFCGKGFITKSKLQAHNRTHTGDKPFECQLCEYKSTQAGNLKLHMKVHQKENAKENESEESSSTARAHVKDSEIQLADYGNKSDLQISVKNSIYPSKAVRSDESNKVLSAYEYHRHLEPCCTQPSVPSVLSSSILSSSVLPSFVLQSTAVPSVLPSSALSPVVPSSVLPSAGVPQSVELSTAVPSVLPSSVLPSSAISSVLPPSIVPSVLPPSVLPSSIVSSVLPTTAAPGSVVQPSAVSSMLTSSVVSSVLTPSVLSQSVSVPSVLPSSEVSSVAEVSSVVEVSSVAQSSAVSSMLPLSVVPSSLVPSSIISPVLPPSVTPTVLPNAAIMTHKKLPSYSEFLESTNKKNTQIPHVTSNFGQSLQAGIGQDVSSFVELKSTSSKEHNLMNTDIQTTSHQTLEQTSCPLPNHYSLLENTHPMEVTDKSQPTPLPEVTTLSKNIKSKPVQSQTLYAAEHAEHVPMHMMTDTPDLQSNALTQYDQSSVHSQYDSQFSSLAEAMYASQQTDDYSDNTHLNTVYSQPDIYGISRSDLENVAQVYQNTFGFDYVSTVQSIYESNHTMNENQSSNYSSHPNKDQNLAHHGKTIQNFDQMNQGIEGHLSLDQTADLGKYSQQKMDYVATAITSGSDLEYCKQDKDQQLLSHSIDYGQVHGMNDPQSQYMQSSLLGSLQQTHMGINSSQYYPHTDPTSLANVGMNTQMPLQGSDDASKMYQYPSYT